MAARKKTSPAHVVLDRQHMLCRHCGDRQQVIPDSGLSCTRKSLRAWQLLCEDFQERHAGCVETERSPSKRAGESIDDWLMSEFEPPADPGDFGRCYRLLQLFPDFRPRLSEVSARFPAWKPLVDAWDELTALYEEEVPHHKGDAPKLYARMRALRGMR